jgi:Leucine-rich repeat (LRR) protein
MIIGCLQILKLECCNLLELDGISSMRRLKELHLPRNHIHDLEPLSSVSAPIEVIDLSGLGIISLFFFFFSLCCLFN